MPFMYDALHNTVRRYEDNEVDALDSRGLLKYGKKIRLPLMMRDSATVDNVQLISRQEMQDWAKAELGARWKGGLQTGDSVRIGDRNLVVAETPRMEKSNSLMHLHPRRTLRRAKVFMMLMTRKFNHVT